ncbi:hypothetical protein BG418_11850 [Streptomyces sp. CBMA152]|nr:hypothetical protein [Streptomyces sp. CBMA152]
MFSERTSVGLDVHAHTTMAWARDCETGQVFSQCRDAETHNVMTWVAGLPQPVAVAYEAGPTGFFLARAYDDVGVRCAVAAPSKTERPAGDRIKEVGDWQRFTGATNGAYLGLVPIEHSSDPNRALGPITKTGNSHARRLLVEASWQHYKPYRRPGVTLRRRRELPHSVRLRADLGNRRLHQRWENYPTSATWNASTGSEPWLSSEADRFGASLPWRTFRWRAGHKHYSGTYSSSSAMPSPPGPRRG